MLECIFCFQRKTGVGQRIIQEYMNALRKLFDGFLDYSSIT